MKWRMLVLGLAVLAMACFTIIDRDGAKAGSSRTQERVEVRNHSGEVITTLWPPSRDLLLFFANAVAREYELPMHTYQLSDGVAIQFGLRPAKREQPRVEGVDCEVTLTLSNGRLKRTFRLVESELSFNRLAKLWMMMGYRVGCSTGGDNWSITRKEYVPPELHHDLDVFIKRFTKAVIEREPTALSSFFASTTHFQKKVDSYQHDHLSSLEAATRFLRDYPADEIVVCQRGFGIEGQETLWLAGRSKEPAIKEWFVYFWIVKKDGKRVITQVNRKPSFWLHGYKEKE